MKENGWRSRKVVVVGAGSVGATFAYALALDAVADEIVLMDRSRELAEGQVLDLAHGLAFMPPTDIHVGEPTDYRDANVIVITAGTRQQPGETRLDLLRRNAAIIRSIAVDIVAQCSEAVLVVVTNPVDILTHVALKESGWANGQVMGSGTVLDSARFRYALSQHCHIDARNVHAYVLGEHGDSEVPAWSMTHVAGIPLDQYCVLCRKCPDWKRERTFMAEQVRNSAYHIIDYKGATCFAIGLALARVVGAVLRNERSVLTVSTLLQGEYGLEDVCLSVPCVVAQRGVELIIEGPLDPEETAALHRSADVLRKSYAALTTGA